MKNIFLKSTIILMTGTLLTKLLGFIIKIIFTRIIGEGINLFAIIMPTYSLLIAITQLGLPYSISIIMSKNNYRGIHVFSSIIPIALLFNTIIIILVIVLAPYIANSLLKNPNAYLPIISICFIIPFTTISGIIKGYYFGKQNMLPNAVSNIFEQLTRLVIVITVLPIILKKSLIIAISFYIASGALCEIIQIIIYLFFAPKNLKITLTDLKIHPQIVNETLNISIPNVTGRLVGNICYFLEPIILTNILLFVGYSNGFILNEYGIYNAYVIPILTMPTFITQAINTTIIPEISKNYQRKKHIKKRAHQTIIISLVIGLIFCSIIFLFSKQFLNIIYNTSEGIEYLKVLALFFPLFYLEGPLSSILMGLNLTKYSLKVTTIGCIVKLLTILILSLFSIGIYGLIISEITNIFIVIILSYQKLKKLDYI